MSALAQRVATPLVQLSRFAPSARVYAKLEHLLLTGGAFDHIAAQHVAQLRSEIDAKRRCVVAGSGAVCLAYAAALARTGAELTAVAPASLLPEHKILLGMHRLRLVLSEAARGLPGAHERALDETSRSDAVLIYSPLAEGVVQGLFERSAGSDLARSLSAAGTREVSLIAPLGSRALILGVARSLSAEGVAVRTFATVLEAGTREALQDDLFAQDQAPPLEGVELVTVSDATALAARSELARAEGLLVGLSSAGALAAARERASHVPAVALVVGAGDRCFSVDRHAPQGVSR